MSAQLLNETVDLRQSTPGRRSFALQQVEERVEELAEELVDQKLLDAIARAIEINDEARTKRNWWRRDRELNERSRRDAKTVDNEVDRAVGALHDSLKATRSGFRGQPRGEAAEEILETLFASGAAGITRLPFEDELSAVRFLVEQLDSEWSNEVDELGLRPLINRLSSLADQFADALSESETRETTWDEVRAADAEGQTAMLRVGVEILGRFNEPDEMATARKLLAPILEQAERFGALLSRIRRVKYDDPETGEEVTDPEGETETPQDSETSDGETPSDG